MVLYAALHAEGHWVKLGFATEAAARHARGYWGNSHPAELCNKLSPGEWRVIATWKIEDKAAEQELGMIWLEDLLVFGLGLALTAAMGFGLYSTLLFALSSIYGSTAIAQGNSDVSYASEDRGRSKNNIHGGKPPFCGHPRKLSQVRSPLCLIQIQGPLCLVRLSLA